MDETLLGIDADARSLQDLKASVPIVIVCVPVSMFSEVILVPANALFPMDDTLAGMVPTLIIEQLLNASSPMVRADEPAAIDKLVKREQLWNA